MIIGYVGIGFVIGCCGTLIYEWFWCESQKKKGRSYEEMYMRFWGKKEERILNDGDDKESLAGFCDGRNMGLLYY
jgi:hypothetical protein